MTDTKENLSKRIKIRPVKYEDCSRLCDLVRGLCLYQKINERCRWVSPDDFREELFSRRNLEPNKNGIFCSVAESHPDQPDSTGSENDVANPTLVGYLLYTYSFSIIEGKRFYITSFFVEEPFRSCGVGRKLIDYMVEHAHAMGIRRVDVPYMNANELAVSFYKKYGATLVNEEYQLYSRVLAD